MSSKFRHELYIIPEDKANSQIVNGFLLEPTLKSRFIHVVSYADGWKKVIKVFKENHIVDMKKHPNRYMILLIDFDEKYENRFKQIKSEIPKEISDRVFILGAKKDPENLKGKKYKRNFQGVKSFEDLGQALSKDCANNTNEIWSHNLLLHNQEELLKAREILRPFLFSE